MPGEYRDINVFTEFHQNDQGNSLRDRILHIHIHIYIMYIHIFDIDIYHLNMSAWFLDMFSY